MLCDSLDRPALDLEGYSHLPLHEPEQLEGKPYIDYIGYDSLDSEYLVAARSYKEAKELIKRKYKLDTYRIWRKETLGKLGGLCE